MTRFPQHVRTRVCQGLVALGLATVTAGTLLPWPAQMPALPGALYAGRHPLAPSAYALRVASLPLGTLLVVLAAVPVVVTLGELRRSQYVCIHVGIGSAVALLILTVSRGLGAAGPVATLSGTLLQIAGLTCLLTYWEVR